MHLLYARGPLADGSGNPFDASATNIAHCEDTREAGFEEFWSATRVPQFGIEVLSRYLRPGEDERFFVEGEATG
jgi:hypothetical protein